VVKSVTLQTVPPLASTERKRQIREWVVALAENFGAGLSAARIDLLEAGLADLDLEQIHTAFKLCALRRERFFPSLAELRSFVDGGTKPAVAAIDDQLAWDDVLQHCRLHVRADLGQYGPPLPPAWHFAARVAGGLAFLESCSQRDLIFAKERFLAALARWRDGQENFAQMPGGPAKTLIAAAAEQKSLPGSRGSAPTQDDRVTPEYFDEARQRLGWNALAPKPNARKVIVAAHVPPPESFAGTPEGELFRTWGRALQAGETWLSWADYKVRHFGGVTDPAKNPGAGAVASR
jgi:hypothetical protein